MSIGARWGSIESHPQFVQCDHHRPEGLFEFSLSGVFVKLFTIRVITWGTVVASLLSAVLLAGEDAGLPDLTLRVGDTHQSTPRR